VKELSDVPSYLWYHGCGPTAGGMILGYWDGHGFDRLIDGANDWNTNRAAIEDMIASPGHIRDFVPTPDREATAGDPYHADDCVADFVRCSRDPVGYGDSYDNIQWEGMVAYAAFRGYGGGTGAWAPTFGVLWNPLVVEIDAGRPVELYVDASGDGQPDHFVTAIGYDDTPGAPKYACHNTHSHTVQWYDFVPTAPGQPYGVRSGCVFELFHNGDANRDGQVGLTDLAALAFHWGVLEQATWEMGDFDADGAVGLSDLSDLAFNWQVSVTGSGAVPAPTVLAMLCVPAAAAFCRRTRRRAS